MQEQRDLDKVAKCKETKLKFIVKVEKIHPDQMTFQVQEMSLICKGKRDSDGVCESAKRQGMSANCKVQRELSAEGCKVKATEDHIVLDRPNSKPTALKWDDESSKIQVKIRN